MTSRVVAGLVAALFVVAGGRGVMAAWESTSVYQEALRITANPQVVRVTSMDSNDPGSRVERAIDEVSGATKLADVTFMSNAGCADSGRCLEAIVASCDELRLFINDLSGCADGHLSWVVPPEKAPAGAHVVDPAATTIKWNLRGDQADPSVTLPYPSKVLGGSVRNDLLHWPAYGLVFVPEDHHGVASVVPRGQVWFVQLPPGIEAWEDFKAALPAGLSYPESNHEMYLNEVEVVRGYAAIVWSVGGAALAIGLLALFIGAVDRAIERRRQLAALRALGVPIATLRTGQVGQTVLPLVIGIPLAGAIGLLAGAAYLAYGGALDFVPWQSVTLLTAVGFVLVLLVGALTLPAIGGPLRPEFLRRE